ncbi:MAG: M20/M25/M40 family metallo-hydrolase [Pseudomonadota bacterium]
MTDRAAQDRITNWIDGNFEREVSFLSALVRTPSDNPPGDCGPHGEVTAGLIESLGLEVDRHPVPKHLVRDNGMVSATNLIVRRTYAAGGPVVALNAHGDVVAPGEGWTTDPYGATVKDGWLYGRGAAVSKSDFATYLFAMLAVEQAGAALKGTVEFHGTYDEEAGGRIGPQWLLEQGVSKPDLALSAGFSYGIVTAHNGCLHLEVTVNGRSAHAAKPWTGIDALEVTNRVLTALYAERARLPSVVSDIPGIGSPQLTVGLISGGINTNVVPDKITFRLDRRMIPEENPEIVEAGLREIVERTVHATDGATAEIRRILLSEPLRPLPGHERLVDSLKRHGDVIMGEPIEAHGVPLYTDARLYAAANVPVVLFGAGPRSIEEANAHRADERLPLEDLRKATKVVALMLLDLLN